MWSLTITHDHRYRVGFSLFDRLPRKEDNAPLSYTFASAATATAFLRSVANKPLYAHKRMRSELDLIDLPEGSVLVDSLNQPRFAAYKHDTDQWLTSRGGAATSKHLMSEELDNMAYIVRIGTLTPVPDMGHCTPGDISTLREWATHEFRTADADKEPNRFHRARTILDATH